MNGFQANPEELIAKGNRINTISNNYFDEKSKINFGRHPSFFAFFHTITVSKVLVLIKSF